MSPSKVGFIGITLAAFLTACDRPIIPRAAEGFELSRASVFGHLVTTTGEGGRVSAAHPFASREYLFLARGNPASPGGSFEIDAFPAHAHGKTLPVFSIIHPGVRKCQPTIPYMTVANGYLYVLAVGDCFITGRPFIERGEVWVYRLGATGNARPERRISGSHTLLTLNPSRLGFSGLAVDSDGTIYVGRNETNGYATATTPSVVEFAPDANGNVAPARTLVVQTTSTGSDVALGTAWALGIDAAGNLDVGVGPAQEFAHYELQSFAPVASGVATPNVWMIPEGDTGGAFAVFKRSIYQVAGPDACGEQRIPLGIYAYTFGSSTLSGQCALFSAAKHQLAGAATGFSLAHVPRAIAFDAAGYCYVVVLSSRHTGGYVAVFSPGVSGNTSPVRIITIPGFDFIGGGGTSLESLAIGVLR